jgi:hypothetical protein
MAAALLTTFAPQILETATSISQNSPFGGLNLLSTLGGFVKKGFDWVGEKLRPITDPEGFKKDFIMQKEMEQFEKRQAEKDEAQQRRDDLREWDKPYKEKYEEQIRKTNARDVDTRNEFYESRRRVWANYQLFLKGFYMLNNSQSGMQNLFDTRESWVKDIKNKEELEQYIRNIAVEDQSIRDDNARKGYVVEREKAVKTNDLWDNPAEIMGGLELKLRNLQKEQQRLDAYQMEQIQKAQASQQQQQQPQQVGYAPTQQMYDQDYDDYEPSIQKRRFYDQYDYY